MSGESATPDHIDQATGLIAPIFVSPAMQMAFSDEAFLQTMLDFEAALATAEAECGIIPELCVDSICKACVSSHYNINEIGRQSALAGNPAIPLVKALTKNVGGDAARYVHWGATSQDVIDTALMIMARRGLLLLSENLARAISATISLAETHRATVMPGRTLLQHALPITFGAKAAGWLIGLITARRTVRRLNDECIALQFAGAVGTLAALGSDGAKVRAALSRILNLPDPGGPWHSERSRFAEIATGLGHVSGLLSKIATDIMLMMQSEVGEAFEPTAPGRGGSSTMPHKRNPVASAAIRANHRRIAGLVATMLMTMESEHERAPGAWAAEWDTLREIFRLAGGSAASASQTLGGLEINPQAMADNLARTGGLVMAESLMMALAALVGKSDAHQIVEAASRTAIAENSHLAAVASQDSAITVHLSQPQIDAALAPDAYLGTTDQTIDHALAKAQAELEENTP
ncbi:MAG: 3-carboxy-cis,cis-muconate cycloisomerase [Alphaproteobacteria bacterium]